MPEPPVPELRPGLRILLVDDDEFITDMLPRKLRRAFPLSPPLDILTASTPEARLRLAAERAPDVVVSDYNLRAQMNGLQLLDEIARRAPDAVRILMSAHTRREIGPALDSADIHGLVEKPMRLDEMLAPLAKLIGGAMESGHAG